MADDFNASAELAAIKAHRSMARRKRYRSSVLMPHRCELVALRRAGATIGDLAIWLRLQKRLKVATSTISRYLRKLPELQEE